MSLSIIDKRIKLAHAKLECQNVFNFNGTAHFKKCKQFNEYEHLLSLKTSGGHSCILCFNVVHFLNTIVN